MLLPMLSWDQNYSASVLGKQVVFTCVSRKPNLWDILVNKVHRDKLFHLIIACRPQGIPVCCGIYNQEGCSVIVGIGIDIIEIERIQAAINKATFITRVFTPAEQAYCDSRKSGRAASYAARFAGKEAVLKALGTGLTKGNWREIEILPNDLGAPIVQLTGTFARIAAEKNISALIISLTHARQYAAAQVVCWGGN
jgi:holo-[acyl-carrier protein] synthase